MSKYIFFLGGYDAEMAEIRNILESHAQSFNDKRLSWGFACLSSYKDEIAGLPAVATPVFIELKPDITTSPNAIIIDHHDEKAGKDQKTSIEQLADLLGIELSRRQKLISANDRGHISALKELCATDEEITEIRALDRKAQGVTEEDEKLAEESIVKHLEKITENAVIVNSLTNKTSPVFDRLYDKYKHIFVFTPDGDGKEMNYSGTGEIVRILSAIYKKKQKENPTLEIWFGGDLPDYGFFGTKCLLTNEEVKNMIKNNERQIISQHIFMFPFQIKEQNTGETELQIPDVFGILIQDGWEYRPYNPVESKAHYSEYFYFHEFVRKAIFEKREEDDIRQRFDNKEETKIISYYFERTAGMSALMTIHIRDDYNPIAEKKYRSFSLNVDHISFRLFETDIGILAIELHNYGYKDLEDILLINDFGRRIYPQFLGDINGIIDVKNAFFADRIEFKCRDFQSDQCFSTDDFFKPRLEIATYIKKLIGDTFVKTFEPVPIIDDRMYVVCWYGDDNWSTTLRLKDMNGHLRYEAIDDWYRYIFIDGKYCTCQNDEMKRQLIKNFTYARWTGNSTFYGITRFSFMCLTNRSDFAYNILRNHMHRMYYQMAMILLSQRASILKFADDVERISGEIDKFLTKQEETDFEEISKKVEITCLLYPLCKQALVHRSNPSGTGNRNVQYGNQKYGAKRTT